MNLSIYHKIIKYLFLLYMFVVLLFLFLTLFIPRYNYRIISLEGSRETRVEYILKLLDRRGISPPSSIIDAQLIESRSNNGVIGPSDFKSFIWLQISPKNTKKWHNELKPIKKSSLEYQQPPVRFKMWLSKVEFDEASRFYDPWNWFERTGWILISANGYIFIYTSTI